MESIIEVSYDGHDNTHQQEYLEVDAGSAQGSEDQASHLESLVLRCIYKLESPCLQQWSGPDERFLSSASYVRHDNSSVSDNKTSSRFSEKLSIHCCLSVSRRRSVATSLNLASLSFTLAISVRNVYIGGTYIDPLEKRHLPVDPALGDFLDSDQPKCD